MVVAVLLAVATAALVVAVMVHRSKAGEPGLPNPAAVFCEQRGGTTYGPEPMCRLPDGTTVDAWELFRQQSTTSP
jgi:putative hemolysin